MTLSRPLHRSAIELFGVSLVVDGAGRPARRPSGLACLRCVRPRGRAAARRYVVASAPAGSGLVVRRPEQNPRPLRRPEAAARPDRQRRAAHAGQPRPTARLRPRRRRRGQGRGAGVPDDREAARASWSAPSCAPAPSIFPTSSRSSTGRIGDPYGGPSACDEAMGIAGGCPPRAGRAHRAARCAPG